MNISQTISARKVSAIARECANIEPHEYAGQYAGRIAHIETFPAGSAATTWLQNLQGAWYAFQGPSSGTIRCMVLSSRAVQEATVIEIDRMGESEEANELKEYFNEYGPRVCQL